MDLKQLKIIDCIIRGNVVRFYLGDKNLPEPCEHIETVERELITGHVDIVFPFDGYILDSGDYYKDDMKNHKVPCIKYIMPEDWHNNTIIKFYFGDTIETNEKNEVFCNGNKIPGATMMLFGTYPRG